MDSKNGTCELVNLEINILRHKNFYLITEKLNKS